MPASSPSEASPPPPPAAPGRSRLIKTLFVTLALIASALFLALWWALSFLGRAESVCQADWAEKVKLQVREALPTGTKRAAVEAYVAREGWSPNGGATPSLLEIVDFTYCGLGSNGNFLVRFHFDQAARLASFEVETGFQLAK